MMSYAVSSPSMDDADLSWFVDNVVSRSLLQSRGVSQVRRQGGVTREIRVELDPDRLKALGVTAGEISNQLRSMQQEAPGGRSHLNGLVQSVRTPGTVRRAAELVAVSPPLPGGQNGRAAC